MQMYICRMDIHNQCHLLMFLQLCISMNMYHLSVLSIISHRLFLSKRFVCFDLIHMIWFYYTILAFHLLRKKNIFFMHFHN